MQVTAQLRNLHMSPRKVRRVVNLVRGLPVVLAEAELSVRPERAAEPLRKLLQSAVANARHRTEASTEQMRIVSMVVNEGRATRRFRPRSRGMAHPILRRTSHVSVVLDVLEAAGRPKRPPQKRGSASAAPVVDAKRSVAPASPQTQQEAARPERQRAPERSAAHVRPRMPRLPKINRRFFQRKSV